MSPFLTMGPGYLQGFSQVCVDDKGGKEGKKPSTASPPPPHNYQSSRLFIKYTKVSLYKKNCKHPRQVARAFCTEVKGKAERGGPALPDYCSTSVK